MIPELHLATKRRIEALSRDLPQSILLSGAVGIGLRTIALFMADSELASVLQPRNAKGEVNGGGSIRVDAIRQLYDQTRTKQKGRRIIIIDDADRMSRGAQAAFLKLLEEPNAPTHFILTTHHPDNILVTIRSRVQQIPVRPLTTTQTAEFLSLQGVADTKKRTQLQFIAPGLPAEIIRLLGDESYFAAKAKIITDARAFLQSGTYQKLRLIHEYRLDREKALRLLDSAIVIVRHSLSLKPQQNLVQQLATLLEAKERIATNQSIALQLARIVL